MYEIKKAVVIGSGVMGAGIASHLANVGIPTTMLDIVPASLTKEEAAQGLSLGDKAVRNRIVNAGAARIANPKMGMLYDKRCAELLSYGNLEDDIDRVGEADWVVEVVLEDLEVKRALFKKILPHLKPSAILSSNTSGIPIKDMSEGMPDEVKERFLITHFFNPPRAMKLLEFVPNEKTKPEIMEFMYEFGEERLGKGVIFCKDTYGFVGNRTGNFSNNIVLRKMDEFGLSIEEVDFLTGEEIGRPRTGTFRLFDLIGLDLMVTMGKYQATIEFTPMEVREYWPAMYIVDMVQKGLCGNKAGAGFYKKAGKERLVIDTKTLEYGPLKGVSIPKAELTKDKGLAERLRIWIEGDDKYSRFVWEILKKTLVFCASMVPMIADDFKDIDKGVRGGFNWQAGPFEIWDMIGVRGTAERMRAEGEEIPPLVEKLLASGRETFYDPPKLDLSSRKIDPQLLFEQGERIAESADATLVDMGDGVACLLFHGKKDAHAAGFADFVCEAVDIVEKGYEGLVIAGTGKNFCVGADIGGMEEAFAKLDGGAKAPDGLVGFERAYHKLKFCRKPVVSAPYGNTLGGGMELAIHCSRVRPHAETYMGLPEAGLGIMPGGGGAKELLVRMGAGMGDVSDVYAYVDQAFEALAYCKVSTSALEARSMGFLGPEDAMVPNRDYQLYEAKKDVLAMAKGFVPKDPAKRHRVGGLPLYAMLCYKIDGMQKGGYIGEHDALVYKRIAWFLSGGAGQPGSLTEEELMKLEFQGYASLCMEPKSRERMLHFLKTGEHLRN